MKKEITNQTESKLSEVFSIFYGYDAMRPVMQKPFVVGDYTYATDGYTLVRCKSEQIDFEFENKETPLNADGAIPIINKSEIVDLDCIDWASMMTKDETIGDGNDVECGHCKGEGGCDDSLYYKGKFYNYEYECPVCDGSGYEQEEQWIPTGNKTFRHTDMVRFKDTTFYARNFYKLKKVKDIIGGDIELISHTGKDKGAMFKIGFLEILIMPCFSHSENNDNVIAHIE